MRCESVSQFKRMYIQMALLLLGKHDTAVSIVTIVIVCFVFMEKQGPVNRLFGHLSLFTVFSHKRSVSRSPAEGSCA